MKENETDYILKVPFKKFNIILLLIVLLFVIFLFGSVVLLSSIELWQRILSVLVLLSAVFMSFKLIQRLYRKTAIIVTKEGVWDNTFPKPMFIKWENVASIRVVRNKMAKGESVIKFYLEEKIEYGINGIYIININMMSLKIDFYLFKDTLFSAYKEYHKWYVRKKRDNIEIIYHR